LQHHTDIAGVTGCHRHLQLRRLVASDADHIVARREVTIKATSRSDPMHWYAVDGYIGVDVGSKGANRTKNVESTQALCDRAVLLCDRLL
jgi:hypothetical protein